MLRNVKQYHDPSVPYINHKEDFIMKKAVILTAAAVLILSVCFADADESYNGISDIREISRSSDNPVCSDICMEDGTVYILSSTDEGYSLNMISNDAENTLKLTNDAGSYSQDAILRVSGDKIYILDNSRGTLCSYAKDGTLTGTHKLPEGHVNSFDINGNTAYLQFEKRITLTAYDMKTDTLRRSYLFDDGFGSNHYASCVTACREDNTVRLSRVSDEFLIETFDTDLIPSGKEKTGLPFKSVEFDASKPAGDLIANGMIAGKEYDYAPHVSGRFNGNGSPLFSAEIYRFKTGKKYPDKIYKIKGMNNFKGYLKLLGMDGNAFVLYIHDENGSASRSLSGESKTGDFLIRVAI